LSQILLLLAQNRWYNATQPQVLLLLTHHRTLVLAQSRWCPHILVLLIHSCQCHLLHLQIAVLLTHSCQCPLLHLQIPALLIVVPAQS